MPIKEQFGIFGVRINNLNKSELKQQLFDFLSSDKYNWIATINAEILVHAHNSHPYTEVLNKSNLNLIDGSGPQYMSWLKFFTTKVYRYPGVDLVNDVLEIANEKKLKILFFGGEQFKNNTSTAEKTAEIFRNKYPNINIIVEQGGQVSIENNKIKLEQGIIEKLENINPDIVLTALSNPYQEQFVSELQNYLPNTKLAIGIGGSFNTISGYLARAPKIFQRLGLEWLWRLILEPKRIIRIIRAVIIFPGLFIWRLFIPRYRPNVSVAVINKDNKLLLCERLNEVNHWQFPQGGIEEGMTAIETVYEELDEEVGIKKSNISKLYKCSQKHRYTWTKEYLHLVFLNGYDGQRQKIFIARFTGNDNDIKIDNREFINYKWVNINNVEKKLYPRRMGVWKIVKKNLKHL